MKNIISGLLQVAIALLCAAGCTTTEPGRDGGNDAGPDGGAGAGPCWSLNTGEICAGAAAVKITPDYYETVKPELLETHSDCLDGVPACGNISADKLIAAWGRDWTDKFYNDANGNGKFDGFWLAGFQYSRPMQGIHDDIWARTLVLKSGGKSVALVSLDVIGYFNSDLQAIRKKLAAEHPETDVSLMVISSTHSHSSIDTLGIWSMEDPYSSFYVQDPAYLGRVNDDYDDFVNNKIIESIVKAHGALKPAKIKAASKRIGIEGVSNDIRDPFIIDDTLSVLSATATTGENIATLVNLGNHAEALWDMHNQLSSDFPHYLREGLEKGLPAAGAKPAVSGLGGVAIFFQGSSGGMITPYGADVKDRAGVSRPDIGWARTQAIGETLAEKVLEMLGSAPEISDPSLDLRTEKFRVEMNNGDFFFAFEIGIIRKRQTFKIDPARELGPGNVAVDTEIAQVRIGPATIQTVPGEPFPELLVGGYSSPYPYAFGHDIIEKGNAHPPDLSKAPAGPYLRDLMPGDCKFVFALGQDQIGYIIPPYDFINYGEGHYEESKSLGMGTAQAVQDVYVKLSK